MDGTRVRNHSPHVALAATCLLPHPGPRRQLQDTPFKTPDCAGLDSSFMRPRGPCSRLAPALGSTKDVVPASCSPPAPSPPPSSQGFEPHRPPWLSGKNTASHPRPPLPTIRSVFSQRPAGLGGSAGVRPRPSGGGSEPMAVASFSCMYLLSVRSGARRHRRGSLPRSGLVSPIPHPPRPSPPPPTPPPHPRAPDAQSPRNAGSSVTSSSGDPHRVAPWPLVPRVPSSPKVLMSPAL